MTVHGGLRLLTRPRRLVAAVAAVAVAANLLSAVPAMAKPQAMEAAKPPTTSPGPAVKGVKPLPTRFVTPRNDAKSTYRPTRTAWPKAASTQINMALSASDGARVASTAKARAAGSPVWAQPVAKNGGQSGPGSLTIKVADRKATEAAGVDGVLLSVDPDLRSGAVRVGVDYAGFAEAYGGNYGSRLRLVRLPACALTTPTLTQCRTATPLASTNDAATKSVSAEVPMAVSDARVGAAGGMTVLAAVATAGEGGGEGGTYAATDLKPTGSWTGGGSAGSFSYSYPVTVPPAASGLVPRVALSYDSGSVDGQTTSTNAQASWVGDGWSTPRSFVEQSFASCMDDPGGSASPVKTPDRCYDGPLLTLSLNGSSTALVWDKTKGVWKPESDNGEVVTHVENANNGSGTYNTDFWRVTLRDGTSYEFGRNRLPGWSGQTETKSVDYAPVYSPHEGDPCYNAAGFSSSVCTMAYRWNLDYVTDAHGNAMAYYYNQATNYYGRNKGASDVVYVRDSTLARIDYGFTDGGAYGTVPNQVVFNPDTRCVAGTCKPLNAATKANWPDVPFDLICEAGTDCDDWSPSFFSTVRLISIDTQQYNTATSKYEKVDSYALSHTLPRIEETTSPALWLDSITRTGHDTSAGGSTEAITLPSVTFTGLKLPNRVATADGVSSFYRLRLETITTETGSLITAEYELPLPCTAPVTTDPAANTRSCYPVYWTPDGYPNPKEDWFNKYAVTRVASTDPTGGAAKLTTSYKYLGGAAWHYDENEVVKAKYRTYGQFRGYGKVQTFTGDGVNDRRTQAETAYYRGMSKNNNSIVLNLTDSAGGTHEDIDELAGMELESTQYLGESGRIDSSTITSYWVSAATATRSRTGLSAMTAQWVAPVKTYTRQAVTSGGSLTWRNTAADSSYDANTASATFGELTNTYTYTVPVDAAYDQCTTYSYAPVNTGRNLVGLVSQTETVSVACGGFTQGSPASVPGSVNTLTAPGSVNRPAQVVKAERSFYDVSDFSTTFPQSAAPSKGNVTMTQAAQDYASGAYAWQTQGRLVYDSYGRVTDSYDAKGKLTTTGYTMNSVKLVAGTSVKNAAGHESSTTVNPRRGSTLTASDPNKIVTRQQYDAVGRATSVWLYSRPTSSLANYKFAYTVSKTGVSATTTETLNNINGYQKSVTIYDALLRTRQTQAITPQGGRMITDTFYDTHGWTMKSYNGWWDAENTPTVSTPVSAKDLGKAVPNQTSTTYDGLGRAVVVTSEKNGLAVSHTTTVHAGDRTTVVPPTGGVVSTTVTDPIGRKKELHEYSVRPTLTTPADTFSGTFTVTGGTTTISKYGYDQHGNQSTLADANNNPWTSTFNLLGQVVAKSDPDAGNSSMRYDANGNLEEVTDGRGKTLSYTYDDINRKTGEYASTAANQSTANKRAAWVYDNSTTVADVANPIGELTTTIAYRGGQAYTTQQKGFNDFGSSLGTTITIPDTEGALAGAYEFSHTYTSVLGLPLTNKYPAKGSLPAETTRYAYVADLSLVKSFSGLAGYVYDISYDAYSRVQLQTLGAGSNTATVTNIFDEHTSRLKNQLVKRSTTLPKEIDEQAYDYDLVGNITRKNSKRLGATTPAETQCYGYDGLARLTEAWTGTDACATAPTDANKSMVGNTIGAGSAYWTSWQIDLIGNRTQQIQHNLTAGGADTKTIYTYNGNGQNKPHTLTSTTTTGATTGTTSYAYDNAGNTTGRNAAQGNQTLTWDDAGKLTTVTGGTSGNNTFIYDADGNLLLQKEPGKNTLYLPGQQLTLNTATSVVTGSRSLALPGGGTAIRTGSGTAYTFAIADHQGTPTLYLDSTTQNPTWRQYTPYGAPRGATVATPDNRGFLNKPMSPTGLITVGARPYDPTLGRFISVDPLQDTAQPQQWNGYAYANNTPVTLSDPSGMIPLDCLTVSSCPDYRMGDEKGNSKAKAKDRGYCWPRCSGTKDVRKKSTYGNGGTDTAYTLSKGAALAGQLILAPSPEELQARLSAAERDVCSWKILCSRDNRYEQAAMAQAICEESPEWCGWSAEGPNPLIEGLELEGGGGGRLLGVVLPDALTVGRNAAGGYKVYKGYAEDGTSWVYSGITKQRITTRQAQHRSSGKTFKIKPITPGFVTKGEARAIEQALILRDKGLNEINSISPKHKYYEQAVEWGEAWLRINNI